MSAPASPGDTFYLGPVAVDAELPGRQLQVTVHFAFVGGQLTCVGFDVRSFTGMTPKDASPLGGDWTEITSPLLRSVRTADRINKASESARERIREINRETLQEYPDLLDEQFFQSYLEPKMFREDQPRRRGPKPLLNDAALRNVVAPAYLLAAKRPAQAVEAALLASGLLGAIVTPDQARKAVAAARARGFIPPAKRSPQIGKA